MPPTGLSPADLLVQLFEQATPADWPRGLEELCAAHPEHAAELRRRFGLLRATGLDQEPRFDAPGSELPERELPERLGEFRVLRRLGSGGMGMVFVAEQTSLGREVALKVVRPEFLFSDAARERFRREIETIARLQHPAIVPVLTHGEEHGVPFYAMPFLDGCSCDEAIRRLAGRDPSALTSADLRRAVAGDLAPVADSGAAFAGGWWQACVGLMRQVALGLHHAHGRGVIHRDVKPSNILLTPDGRALLFDFGLAHVRDDARMTRTGTAPGSPAYMAPEQMRGQVSDERADVYSLAATLHHLLALRCAFPVDDSELLRARILGGKSEPLPRRVAPVELQVVLAAAMDVDRERRHADAQAFADDLQAVLDQRPIRARPLPAALRMRRWCGRHRTATAVLATVVVAAALLPAALWWQQREANLALAKQTGRAERNFTRSLEVIEQMLVRAGHGKLRDVPAAQRVAADLVQQAIEYFDRMAAEEGDASAFRGRHLAAIQMLADLRSHLGELTQAEALARRNLEMTSRIRYEGSEGRLRRAHGRIQLATIQNRAGDFAAAMRTLDQAESDLQGETPATEQLKVQDLRSRVMNLRGLLLDRTGNADGARAAFEAALAIRRELLASPPIADHRRDAAASAYHTARLLRQKGDTDGGLALVREAMAWLEDCGDDTLGWPAPAMLRASLQVELAFTLDLRKDADGSATAYRSAIEQGERLVRDYPHLPDVRRDLGAARCNLARQLADKREFAQVRDLATAAVADLEYVVQGMPSDAQGPRFLLNARRTQCFALRELGDYAALAPAAREFGRLPGPAEGPRGAARYLLRCAEQATGDPVDALRREAMDLLLESERRGWGKATLDDGLYDPLRSDPRFLALQARLQGKDK